VEEFRELLDSVFHTLEEEEEEEKKKEEEEKEEEDQITNLVNENKKRDTTHEDRLIHPLQSMFQALSEPIPNRRKIQTDFCRFLSTKRSFITAFHGHGTIESIRGLAFSQHDARNFLEYVLEQIKSEINIHHERRNYVQELSNLMYFHTCIAFPSHIINNGQNPIASLGVEPTPNLIDCIEKFFSIEYPENGFERLLQAQYLFIFALNRYYYSETINRIVKIDTIIEIPDAITITGEAFLNQEQISVELQLYAVIVHKGPNTCTGHYYTYIKPDPNGQWYRFNDSTVIPLEGVSFLEETDVLKNAYLHFYKNAYICS